MKLTLTTFFLAITYVGIFYTLQLFLFQHDMVPKLPNAQNLQIWDAGWYANIAQRGYAINPNASNTAFYILLPWLWRLAHVDACGMAAINVLIFAAGFTLFTRIFKITGTDKMLWLTIPSFFFAFIPYTEALFMLLGTLLIWGIQQNKKYLVWTAIFLLSLTRPVSMILFPALLIMEIMTHERSRILHSVGSFLIKYGIPLILGWVFFVWYQHYETGVWLSFFNEEKKWGHEFSWPAFPLNCITGPKTLWIDALALFVGFISIIVLVRSGINWLFKNITVKNNLLILSYLYLAAIFFIVLLFNPKWGIGGTTSVHEAHRYIFVSPFFWMFLFHYQYERKYHLKDYVIIALFSNVFWLAFGSYTHIMSLIYFNFCTAILVLWLLNAGKQYSWPPLLIAVINVYVQIWFFQFFIGDILPS